MSIWDVQVEEKQRTVTRVQVEAKTWEEAREAAWKLMQEGKVAFPPAEVYRDADPRRQRGEPWVSFEFSEQGWYDLHGPGDVIVMKRAHGYVFTLGEVHLLRDRLNALGLTVVDRWNGVSEKDPTQGFSTVSFRAQGRPNGRDPMTAAQKAQVLAPRPPGLTDREEGK